MQIRKGSHCLEDFLSESVRIEVVLLLSALFIGMMYGFIYDTIRIIRRVIVHRKVLWIAIEDIVFWIVVALHSYVTFYYGTNGIMRGYIVIGIVCGAGLYRVSVGTLYLKYVTRIVKFVVKPLKKAKAVFKIHLCKR